MKVFNAGEAPFHVRPDGVTMTDFFSEGKVTMGHAVFPPKTVVPWAAHTGDEFSFILTGCAKCETKAGGVHVMSAGAAGFIPAGEEHSSFNDSDEECTLVWMLVER